MVDKTAQDEKKALKQRFVDYTRSGNMRWTQEREAIVEAIVAQPGAFTVTDIWNDVAKLMYMSRASIYNNIALMLKAGLIRRSATRQGSSVSYEIAGGRRTRLICDNCGEMKYVTDEGIAEFLAARKIPGFVRDFRMIDIYGLCSKCSKKLNKKEKNNNLKSNNLKQHGKSKTV